MPKAGFLGWAYVTGSAASVSSGTDGALAYYDGAGTALNDASGLKWDKNSEIIHFRKKRAAGLLAQICLESQFMIFNLQIKVENPLLWLISMIYFANIYLHLSI